MLKEWNFLKVGYCNKLSSLNYFVCFLAQNNQVDLSMLSEFHVLDLDLDLDLDLVVDWYCATPAIIIGLLGFNVHSVLVLTHCVPNPCDIYILHKVVAKCGNVYGYAVINREVNKNNLLGGHFLIFLPKNPGNQLTEWADFNFWASQAKLCIFPQKFWELFRYATFSTCSMLSLTTKYRISCYSLKCDVLLMSSKLNLDKFLRNCVFWGCMRKYSTFWVGQVCQNLHQNDLVLIKSMPIFLWAR